MKFHQVKPDINFRNGKWVSENLVWELGLAPMLFGVRIRAGLVGCGLAELDYCAGADVLFQYQLLDAVIKIMEKLPESVTSGEISWLFPEYYRKPIDKDPCWERLQEMAKPEFVIPDKPSPRAWIEAKTPLHLWTHPWKDPNARESALRTIAPTR